MRYSNDLRAKVIDLVKSGKEQKEVAELLDIDKSTVYRWYKRYRETGDCNHLNGYDTGRKSKISDISILEKAINTKPDSTLHELCKQFNVSFMTIYRGIKKLGYTFKKSHGYTKKEMKKKERNS